MFFLAIVVGLTIGLLLWQFSVENFANLDVKIPQSQNIKFNDQLPIAMTTVQIANEFEKADGKPILLYIYATWCGSCSKNFPAINEIIREFQNTELQVITLSIDRDQEAEHLQAYLNQYGDVYFQPRFLAYKEGFLEFFIKETLTMVVVFHLQP